MEIDSTTFKPEADGAFSVLVDKKPTRLVKETDLLALKGANEERVKQWESERTTLSSKVEESTKAHEATRQTLLQEQALKEKLAEQYKDYDTWKAKVGELEKQNKEHQTSLQKHQEELAVRIRKQLISAGAKEESLKDKTLDQLRNLEEAASIFVGAGRKTANYEGGGGGGGSAPETPFERAKRTIAEQEQRQGRVAQVASPK